MGTRGWDHGQGPSYLMIPDRQRAGPGCPNGSEQGWIEVKATGP